MLGIEDGKQSGIGGSDLRRLGVVEFADFYGVNRARLQRGKARQPFSAGIGCGDSDAPVGAACRYAQKVVRRGQLPGIVDLVDIVDEQRRAAAARQFIEQLI